MGPYASCGKLSHIKLDGVGCECAGPVDILRISSANLAFVIAGVRVKRRLQSDLLERIGNYWNGLGLQVAFFPPRPPGYHVTEDRQAQLAATFAMPLFSQGILGVSWLNH